MGDTPRQEEGQRRQQETLRNTVSLRKRNVRMFSNVCAVEGEARVNASSPTIKVMWTAYRTQDLMQKYLKRNKTDTERPSSPRMVAPFSAADPRTLRSQEGSTAVMEIWPRRSAVCKGGSPLATVVWLQDGQVVDRNTTQGETSAFNSLSIPASRKDLSHSFTCKGSNNDATPPLVVTYKRNVNCGPLSVTITPEEKPIVAGRLARLQCTVVGSNPPPTVTWYQQGQQVTPLHTQVEVGDNMTVSVLLLQVTREHHRKQLVCRAQHPTLPLDTLEDIFTLNVSFPRILISNI
ncbi:nephrin-like [Penaeus monodon]|uniref:nephrin-like n=1 Tax=Penaeus monodon TaxID=6687 RepID=UPI0018A7474B|nr:nephrin-like [Penaeus monodon]